MEYSMKIRFDPTWRRDDARDPRFSSLSFAKFRVRSVYIYFEGMGRGQFDFREQLWRIPGREPTRKCFEWKKKRGRGMSKSYW